MVGSPRNPTVFFQPKAVYVRRRYGLARVFAVGGTIDATGEYQLTGPVSQFWHSGAPFVMANASA